jgi:hypothetical protein
VLRLTSFLPCWILVIGIGGAPAFTGFAAQPGDKSGALDYEIQLDVAHSGYDGIYCWVHPRAGIVPRGPGRVPAVVMTMQKLWLKGSDVFFAITELRTNNLGRSWLGPYEHPETLGRRLEPNGIVVTPADFWPKWHVKSGKLLGIGVNARYLNEAQVPTAPRETVYSVYDPDNRTWAPWKSLAVPNEDRFFHGGAGSVQRVDEPNGDILLPVYTKGRNEDDYRVIVLRCRFDGTTLTVAEIGNELTTKGGRGFAEPSLAKFAGRYFLTLRNDKAGYVAISDDGLHFGPPKLWTWDDGTELGSYNTQQHWITHQKGLFLVYTRKGANNDHIPRHRAPLFMAQVDPERLTVRRNTERVLVPERGAGLGNFGVTEVSPDETWVTTSEWMQSFPPHRIISVDNPQGANNSIYVARIRWSIPNDLGGR